jgi:DNA-directed RNA polymerase subunit beta
MAERKITKVKYGNTERMSFAQSREVIDMPDLVEVQKKSYNDFIDNGIKEVLADFSPITDYSNRVELFFEDYSLGFREGNNQKRNYTEKECKDRDATFAVPLYVKVRLRNCETDESTRSEVYMGDLPKMTPTGSFIINGAERVVVSQLVRSPGVYFDYKKDIKTGQAHYSAQNIPSRGAWLEFEEDSSGVLWVRVDRQKKVLATILLSCFSAVTEGGFGTDEKLREIFNNDPMIELTCQRYADKEDKPTLDEERALYELNHKLRSGETPTIDSIKQFIYGMFFDRRKYDISRVGRYKYNKKLALRYRVAGLRVAKDVIDEDGIVYARAENKQTHTSADILTEELAEKIQNAGINKISVLDEDGKEFEVISNAHVALDGYIDVDPRSIGINERVYYPALKELMDEADGDRTKLAELCAKNVENLIVKHIVVEDVIATVNYIMGLHHGLGSCDNIDHLGNRRVRSVGELLQNQFRIGMSRLERVVRERMQIQTDAELSAQTLINVRPVSSAIKEFFGSSQLSQFMDETNPIAELTHKRKLSALGPGGLNREHVTFEVRDVHYTHYSRMCPIETPEGQNIGLISSLSSYARINEYGYIEAPYRKVDKVNRVVTSEVEYLPADEGGRTARRRGSVRAAARHDALPRSDRRGVERSYRLCRRFAAPDGLRRYRAYPVPRERRLAPCANGVQHAASGSSSAQDRSADSRHGHRAQDSLRLGRYDHSARGGHCRLCRRGAYHRQRGRRLASDVYTQKVRRVQPRHLYQSASHSQ